MSEPRDVIVPDLRKESYFVLYVGKQGHLICDEYDKEEEAKSAYLHTSINMEEEKGPIVIKGFKASTEIVAKFNF